MADQRLPGLVAPLVVVVVAVSLLLPYLALTSSQRRRLSPRRTALYTVTIVYAITLLAYVTLPLPRHAATFCARHHIEPNLSPLRMLGDLGGLRSPGSIASNPAFVQFGFNVALFVPFGVLVCAATRFGTRATILTALGTSLGIELTQLTGVWFAYPCAYRTFDVDDILANTIGAAMGALLAPAVVSALNRRFARRSIDDGSAAADTERVTTPRRLSAMTVDLLVTGASASVIGVAWDRVVAGSSTSTTAVAWWTTALVQLAVVAATGATVGELALGLTSDLTTADHHLRRTAVRWAAGIGGFAVLIGTGSGPAVMAAVALGAGGAVVVVWTSGGQSLACALAGMRMRRRRPDYPKGSGS